MITNLKPVEYSAQLIITTEQLANFYECSTTQIKQNFNNNKEHFFEGKHFFKLEGEDLKLFKNKVENFDLVGKNANVLYLWTKRGCARHCKSVGTDVAWDVFEVLEDTYFNVEKIIREAPMKSVSDFKRGRELGKLAAHAEDPYTKRRLVARAANLILGEEFLPVPDFAPLVQMTLFK